MNKKVLKVAFVAAIALVSGINVFNAQKAEVLSETVLANVEALAGDESGTIKVCPQRGGTCTVQIGDETIVVSIGWQDRDI